MNGWASHQTKALGYYIQSWSKEGKETHSAEHNRVGFDNIAQLRHQLKYKTCRHKNKKKCLKHIHISYEQKKHKNVLSNKKMKAERISLFSSS